MRLTGKSKRKCKSSTLPARRSPALFWRTLSESERKRKPGVWNKIRKVEKRGDVKAGWEETNKGLESG